MELECSGKYDSSFNYLTLKSKHMQYQFMELHTRGLISHLTKKIRMKDHSLFFSFSFSFFSDYLCLSIFYDFLSNLTMSNDPSILYISYLILKFHKFLQSQSNLLIQSCRPSFQLELKY